MNESTDNEFDHLSSVMDRRAFMTLLSVAAAACPLPLLAAKHEQTNDLHNAEQPVEPWLTLSATQQHLFPAEMDSPGASDINALAYLRNMLQAPDVDVEEKKFIQQGATWLNDIARKQKSRPFVQLDETEREQVLRAIEQSRAGERWLSLILTYLLEALLSDPVYGGNPDGIGWRWLQHQPGYPTPPEDKMYYKLAQRHTFKRTRA